MSKTIWALITVLALVPIASCPAGDQSDGEAGTRFKRTKRAPRPVSVSDSDEDDPDQPDGDPNASGSTSPQPFSRPAGSARTAVSARSAAADSARPRVQSAPVVHADDPSDDPFNSLPPQPRKATATVKTERDAQRPQRISTINRAEVAAQPAHRKPTTLLTQFEEEQNADDEQTEGPPVNQSPASSDVQSLEARIAELTARLDALTAAQGSAPPGQSPSTVQGSVFGPDAPPPSNGMGGTAPGSGPAETREQYEEASTVQGSVFGPDVGPGSTWTNDGLTFTSKDKNFRTHLGGLVQMDLITFAPNTPGITSVPGGAGTQSTVEFRRLRARADGTMHGFIDWVMEFDFAFALQNTDQLSAAAPATGLRSFPTGVGIQGGNTMNVIQPSTIFMTFKDLPFFGNIRVGNQQDWFSFEHIESARFQDFMERSPVMDMFAGPNNNGYIPGITAFNLTKNERMGWQVGVYKNTAYDSGFTYDVGDAWTYGGRLIGTPYYDTESKGRYMVHTGFGFEYRTFNDLVSATTGFDNVRLRSRGVLRNTASTLDPNYVDTGNFYTTAQALIDPELVIQMGPFLFQSEYTASWFYGAKPAKNVATNLGSVFMQAYYAELLWFLTGENRDYNRLQGIFNRVVPKQNFNPKKGTWGAWQLGARYDFTDANYGLVNGGNASDMTFGINWFLNANARFQFNYVLTWVNNAPPATFPGTAGALNGSRFVGDGIINSFGARLDYNF